MPWKRKFTIPCYTHILTLVSEEVQRQGTKTQLQEDPGNRLLGSGCVIHSANTIGAPQTQSGRGLWNRDHGKEVSVVIGLLSFSESRMTRRLFRSCTPSWRVVSFFFSLMQIVIWDEMKRECSLFPWMDLPSTYSIVIIVTLPILQWCQSFGGEGFYLKLLSPLSGSFSESQW